MKKMEEHNTLVFTCDLRANKHQIRSALKTLYEVDAKKINTLVTMAGTKKAYVLLPAGQEALEVAGKIGFI